MAAFTGSARAADLVLITSRRHGLVALDTHGGTMRWSAPAPFPAMAPPAADGARAYACSAAGVRAFDLRDGAELWAAPLPRAIHTVAPLPAGDLVLQATGGGVLVALEAETGAERWRVSTDPALAELGPYRRGGPSTGARPVRHGDQVLFGADDGRLRCVDLGTGTLRWRADLGAPISGCVARGNLVLVALRSGEVVALRPPVHRTEP